MSLVLHMDFAADKTIVPRIGPTPTFLRADAGSYFDSNGILQSAAINVARFDHDMVTKESLGLLGEPTRENLGLFAEDTTNGVWVGSNMTEGSDSVTIPDDTASTTVRLTAAAANATFMQTITSGAADRSYAVFLQRVIGSGNIQLTVDGGATWTTVTVENFFTRVEVNQSTVTNPQFGIRLVTSGDAVNFWGSDIEIGRFSTSYKSTAASATTRRREDIESSDLSWYPEAEGTLYMKASTISDVTWTGSPIVVQNHNDDIERLTVFHNRSNGNNQLDIRTGNATTVDLRDADGWDDNEVHNMSSSYKLNDFELFEAGVRVGTGSQSSPVPTKALMTRWYIGQNRNKNTNFAGHIRVIRGYDERLANDVQVKMANNRFPGEGLPDGRNWPVKGHVFSHLHE